MEIKVKTAQGIPLSQLAAECGIDRKTARKLRDANSDPSGPMTRIRKSRFSKHTEYISERLNAGVPIAQIARDLRRVSGEQIPYTSFWELRLSCKQRQRSPKKRSVSRRLPLNKANAIGPIAVSSLPTGRNKSCRSS